MTRRPDAASTRAIRVRARSAAAWPAARRRWTSIGASLAHGDRSTAGSGTTAATRDATADGTAGPRAPARSTCSAARTLAGEAAAAAAEVETALERRRRPDRGGVLRRRQHRHAGRLDLPPRPRPAPPRVLHHPRHPRGRLEAGLLPGRRRRGPRARRRGPRLGARASSPGTPSASSRSSARRSSTRRWRTGSGRAPGRSPSCTSTRASGSGW